MRNFKLRVRFNDGIHDLLLYVRIDRALKLTLHILLDFSSESFDIITLYAIGGEKFGVELS